MNGSHLGVQCTLPQAQWLKAGGCWLEHQHIRSICMLMPWTTPKTPEMEICVMAEA